MQCATVGKGALAVKQYPRIYDAHMRPLGDLRTAEFTDLKQRQTPFDTVTLTVPTADAGSFGYRQFVELFDSDGKRIDIFRVSEVPKKTYAPDGMMRMTCDQALCTLKDGLVPGYHQFGGTTQNLRGVIESVLAYQSEPLWALERCDFDTHYEYGICDESPYTALLMLLEPIPDAMIVTDTTERPWKLSVVRMTDEGASELRYSRNMEEVVETIQDGFFATRLFPRGYGEGVNQLTIRDVNGGVEYIEAPQAVRDTWGTVSEPYINTTITDALTLKAEAEVALELCQTPNVSYKVKAADLSKLTGEPLDAFYKGRMVRMIYRETGLVVRTRVTEIHKPKPKAEPWNAKLTLSTQPQSVATVIADLARQSKIQNTYGQGSTFIYADSFEQNCDKDTPAEGDIYIPESMIHVNAIMLKVTASAYRADSRGAAGGGGTVQTTGAGGGGSSTSEAGGLQTVTVPLQTVSTGVKYTGQPVDEDGGADPKTGGPKDYLGNVHTSTDSAGGHTHSMTHTHIVSSHGHTFTGEPETYTIAHNHILAGDGALATGGIHTGNKNIKVTPKGTVEESGVLWTSSPYDSVGGSVKSATGENGIHAHSFAHVHDMPHMHSMEHEHTVPSQAIRIEAHTHRVSIPEHTHTLTLEAHEHQIVYGIFRGPRAAAFTVEVDGKEVPASAFDGNGVGDIAPYLGADSAGKILRGTFHTLRIRPAADEGNPTGLCRIRASWSAQVFISSLTGRQY